MSLSLVVRLSLAFEQAFAAEGLDRAFGQVVRSLRPGGAPFQCNGAMAAAKAAGRPPRTIADAVAARLSAHIDIEALEVAGPGFINITPTRHALTERARHIAAMIQSGAKAPSTAGHVVIDYGGPNVAKALHVGHLRSAVIGDSLQRIFRFAGWKVTSDIHLGDWGLQMGHLVTEIEDEMPHLPYFDAALEGPYPDASPVTLADLSRLYPQASARAKEDPARLARSRKATAALQAGHKGYRALLAQMIAVSVAALKADYAELGAHFDLWKGESDVAHLIPDVVADLKARGVAELDDGALIVRIGRDDDKKELPPLILVSREGSSLYGTTDLATILDRKQTLAPDRILYVVDQRQHEHFTQVFRAAERAGYADADTLEHIGFGTVNGPDGKPIKTKDGTPLTLRSLLDETRAAVVARIEEGRLSDEITADERETVIDAISLAALKFADLHNPRLTNYKFEADKFVSFEGKTGPYLLYAAVRIKSILRRAEDAVHPNDIQITDEFGEALVLALDGFDSAVAQAVEKRSPHFICEHLYGLAAEFSRFYAHCPILPEKDKAKRCSRLALARLVHDQLVTGLSLLGITVPERM
jgi:arginyl-tRNA synthetase